MKAPVPRDVDLRAFRSRLSPLQKKLDAQLQAARSSLAGRTREAAALAEQVRLLREREAQEAAAAMQDLRDALDVRAHGQSVRHLVHLGRQCSAHEAALREAEQRVSDGRKECIDRDRQLAVVQRLQERELREHAAVAARRQSRDADLAWLARVQGGRVA